MASDIVTTLELDKKSLSSKTFVIKEINGCDSSFVASCVFGHFIRVKSPVLIISSHNSIKHYHNVGLKMNYNLNRGIESGFINFYDIGKEYVNKVITNEGLPIETIYKNIKEKIELIQKQFNVVNIVFDGVSHLLDMQYNLREVNFICTNIINLVRSYSSSILIFHCNVAQEHDVTCILANLLSHKAHTILEVEHLASGLSNDVSGHLTLQYPGRKFEDDRMFSMDPNATQYLFKLFDRGVKLLAPGTV